MTIIKLKKVNWTIRNNNNILSELFSTKGDAKYWLESAKRFKHNRDIWPSSIAKFADGEVIKVEIKEVLKENTNEKSTE